MSTARVRPSGVEAFFGADEIIVSKTDCKGIITYANDVFQRISGYSEAEVIGKPHSLVRHPDMPRSVFKLLWDTIAAGREVFAYVVNLAKDGSHYWVLAHVTPTFDPGGRILGYHSNRRSPRPEAVRAIRPLYDQLLAEEGRDGRKEGLTAGSALLERQLRDGGQTYDEFIWSLISKYEERV